MNNDAETKTALRAGARIIGVRRPADVYSRDIGRGNSREGGGMRRPAPRCRPPPSLLLPLPMLLLPLPLPLPRSLCRD